MTNNLTQSSYRGDLKIVSSGNKNLMIPSRTNWIARKDTRTYDWENKVRCHGGLQQTISYYVKQQKKYEIEIVNGLPIWKVPYRSFHDLFEKSLCTNDELVKVYVPIYFMDENGNGSNNTDNLKKELEREQNVKLSLEIGPSGCKIFIHNIQIGTELSYQSTIIPLTNLSKKCVLQYKRFGYNKLHRTIIKSSNPVLEFTFTHTKYMDVLKCITSREYRKGL
jgi:hypothetical protein